MTKLLKELQCYIRINLLNAKEATREEKRNKKRRRNIKKTKSEKSDINPILSLIT